MCFAVTNEARERGSSINFLVSLKFRTNPHLFFITKKTCRAGIRVSHAQTCTGTTVQKAGRRQEKRKSLMIQQVFSIPGLPLNTSQHQSYCEWRPGPAWGMCVSVVHAHLCMLTRRAQRIFSLWEGYSSW